MTWISDHVDASYDKLVDTRRWLHQRPELAFEEHETTGLVRGQLEYLGWQAETCPTDTGAVASLQGGRPGRTVLIRCDIDALPVREAVDVSFRSLSDDRMHACGHDAHTTIALGVAAALATRAEDLPGRYVVVFQPAEEGLGGARAMIEGGMLDDLAPDAAVGCHVTPMRPVGLVSVRAGIAMSDAVAFRLRLGGPGAHGAMVGTAGNVVLAVASVAGQLPGVVTDLSYEGTDCACSAGVISAGRAANVVPTSARLDGTLRTFTPEQRTDALGRLQDLCDRAAAEFAVTVELEIVGSTPAVRNDIGATTITRRAVAAAIGADHVLELPPAAPSDDMAEFLARIPGCYFFVGAGDPQRPSGAHHSATFALDEGCLRTGTVAVAEAALALAAPGSQP